MHLINTPPTEWGNAEKVSDSSIKMITEFSGDSSDNEQESSVFLRGIFALANHRIYQKNLLLTFFRKLTGSAYILTDQYIHNEGNDVNSLEWGQKWIRF